MPTTIKRYNPKTVATIVQQLGELIECSQDSLDNEESRDYPNDERIDMLTDRLDGLQTALDALEGIL